MASASRFRKLVSRNEDLAALVDRGYAVTFDSGWMVIRDVPYLDQQGALQWGALATKLIFVDAERVEQEDHTVLFAGAHPCGLDGVPIRLIDAGAHTLTLSQTCKDVAVERRFSNKPRETGRFDNFSEKIESYVGIICAPAMHKYGVTPFTFKTVEDDPQASVFKFQDSLTSKAEIGDLSRRFDDEVVAIVGLGGTGAAVLDFLVKTPVREIRGFDGDAFHVHNAFRSLGRLDERELGARKADVYQNRYSNFREGLKLVPRYVDSECGDAFDAVTFAFVCVDKGSARAEIFNLLIAKGIPFIDVGMGLKRDAGPLRGMLRVTYYPPERAGEIRGKGLAEMSDAREDLYRTNVQIGELNALNAALAVIRYKQLRGFYSDDMRYYQLLLDLVDLKTVGESLEDED